METPITSMYNSLLIIMPPLLSEEVSERVITFNTKSADI